MVIDLSTQTQQDTTTQQMGMDLSGITQQETTTQQMDILLSTQTQQETTTRQMDIDQEDTQLQVQPTKPQTTLSTLATIPDLQLMEIQTK
jgi:hypothetical protein